MYRIPTCVAIVTVLLGFEKRHGKPCTIAHDVIGEDYGVIDLLTFFKYNGERRSCDRRVEASKAPEYI